MKDYFNIEIPVKFRAFNDAYPDFHKPIGIVSKEDLNEARNESGVHWLIIDKQTTAPTFINNRKHPILFFVDGSDKLIQQLQEDGYKARKYISESNKYKQDQNNESRRLETEIEALERRLKRARATNKSLEHTFTSFASDDRVKLEWYLPKWRIPKIYDKVEKLFYECY
jgi:hypothetical protein